MYFFYVDEAGTRDPYVARPESQKGGNERIYVLTAISLFEHRWNKFDRSLSGVKRDLMDVIYRNDQTRLKLSDCEIKSSCIRLPKQRAQHPFLSKLASHEVKRITDTFYDQLKTLNMNVFSVIVDKSCLKEFMDRDKIHRKAWEFLLEMVEKFLRLEHDKHKGILIVDDINQHANRSLAMKHAHLLVAGTGQSTWLNHIAEMPLFVRSELSNGVQLADLVGYNVFRRFLYPSDEYEFFDKILPHLWMKQLSKTAEFGLWVFSPESPLKLLGSQIKEKRALLEQRPC